MKEKSFIYLSGGMYSIKRAFRVTNMGAGKVFHWIPNNWLASARGGKFGVPDGHHNRELCILTHNRYATDTCAIVVHAPQRPRSFARLPNVELYFALV